MVGQAGVEHPLHLRMADQVLGERPALLLLALHGDPFVVGAHLQQEQAVAGTTDCADGERLHLVELEENAHAGLRTAAARRASHPWS